MRKKPRRPILDLGHIPNPLKLEFCLALIKCMFRAAVYFSILFPDLSRGQAIITFEQVSLLGGHSRLQVFVPASGRIKSTGFFS